MGKDVLFSLIVKLPLNDPQFKEKKVMLQNKGFDVENQISFGSLSNPNWTNVILHMMLQRFRIINLNEVELYFDESDKSSPMEFYSPRNELESLSSVLGLIDMSLSVASQSTRCLIDLRMATLARIQDFHCVNKLESVIASNICDMEKSLLQWGEDLGVKSKIDISCVEEGGRGAVFTHDLHVGDIALEIPVSIVISDELLRESDMLKVLEKMEGITSETSLLLWSMKERYSCNSKFKMYFDVLPEDFNTGLSFGIDAIMTLEGTVLLDMIVQAKQHLRQQYDELFPKLCEDHADIFPKHLYTWEKFLWACELWYSNSMKVKYTDGTVRTCLIPIAGFLNHSLSPHILHYGEVDPKTNSLKFPVSVPCEAGEQCCLSYGNFSSSHFITFYGFLPQGDNYYDVIPLDIDCGSTDCGEQCGSNCTSVMIRGTWLSQRHDLFHYGLPSPLLDNLRNSQRHLLPAASVDNQRCLETELEVLEVLIATFGDMMDILGESHKDGREVDGWDVKLAVSFKDLQRRVVSSVLTSCYSGRALVENELQKLIKESQ